MTRAVVALLLLPLFALLVMPALAQPPRIEANLAQASGGLGTGGSFSYPFRFGLTTPKSAPELTMCTSVSRCILFVFSFIFKILIWIAGGVAVIALVLAGITYIGKPEEAQRVHTRIVWALVGIAVALASFALVRIIEATLTRGFAVIPVAYAQCSDPGDPACFSEIPNAEAPGSHNPTGDATPVDCPSVSGPGYISDSNGGCSYVDSPSDTSSGVDTPATNPCDPNDPNCFDENIINPPPVDPGSGGTQCPAGDHWDGTFCIPPCDAGWHWDTGQNQCAQNGLVQNILDGLNGILGSINCAIPLVPANCTAGGGTGGGTGGAGAGGAGTGGGAGAGGNSGGGTGGSAGAGGSGTGGAATTGGGGTDAGARAGGAGTGGGGSANNPLNQFRAPSGLAGIPGCNSRHGLSVFNYLRGQQVPAGLLGTCTLGLLGLKILPFIYTVVLLLSVGYLIVFGYEYVTSGGQVTNLHQKLLWAIIGVIVAVVAFSAVKALEIALTVPESLTPGGNNSGQIIDGQHLPPPAP